MKINKLVHCILVFFLLCSASRVFAQSANANLSALTMSAGTLSPGFTSGTAFYTASVPNTTSTITVTPTRDEANATIKVNTITVASGSASGSIQLAVGVNVITIIVTAQNGTTTNLYAINVTRLASTVATLSNLTVTNAVLSPSFTSANGTYTANVAFTVSSMTVTPTKTEATATIKVNGVTTNSGNASAAINLAVGVNVITVLVTAQDGTTTKSYSLNVTRAAGSTIATLSTLSPSTGTLSPVFTAATEAYTTTVPFATTTYRVTATKTETNATIRVNGVLTTSGTQSAVINLVLGANVVTVLVTAQDGTTTKTYTITVTRTPASTVNTLATLSVGATLSPAFSPSVTSYTGLMPGASTQLSVSFTVPTNSNAVVKVGGIVRQGTFAIPTDFGITNIVIEVTAENGDKREYTFVITRPKVISNVATLSNMAYVTTSNNAASLVPNFSGNGSSSYSVKVSRLLTSMAINATVSNPGSIVKINGVETASGVLSTSVPLGDTPLQYTISVLSTDSTSTRTYSLTVSKEGPSADLSSAAGGFTLTPVFDRAITSYTGIVSNTTTSTTFSCLPFEATATLKVNGVTTAFATGLTIPLPIIGVNPIVIDVTNATGLTKTYTFNITRVPPQVADLSSLRIFSSGLTSPSFTPLINDYSISVINDSTSVQVIATPFTAGATMKINGVSVVPPARPSVNLVVGVNLISVVVTSEDGLVSKTYTLKIIRAALGGAIPSSAGAITLSPTANEVTVSSPTQALTVTIPAGTVNPGVNYSTLITGGTGTIPQTTILSDVSSVAIPAATKVTSSDPNWNGVIGAPVVTTYDLPPVYGEISTPGLIIEVGSPNISLSFDKAVRLILPGQANTRAAFVHSGIYKEITTIGTSDTQAAGDALPADGAFKMNVGPDLVIWTKAFSKFITFTQSVDLNVAIVASDMDGLTADMIKGANADLDHITTVLTDPLPSTLTGGSTVTWSSSNPAVISADGKTVNRQLFGAAVPVVTLTATVKKGFISENKTFTLTIVELANQAPTLSAIANQVLCFTTGTQSIALSGITAGPESGQTTTLTISSSNTTLLKQLAINNTTGVISYVPNNTAGGTTTITVTIKDDGGTANGGADTFTRTFTVIVNPLPVVTINSTLGTSISKGFTAVLSASGGVSYTWADATGIIGAKNTATLTVRPAATTTYTVTAVNPSGCTTVKSITVTVLEDYRSLDIANIVTPNGDGKNDALVIKNLDMYPDNTLKIFDRGGRQVYVKQNYTNDWKGTLDGAQLAQDTYYYILYFGAGKGQLKGFVSIVK